jgi:DNA-binding PadR family transcriptional regulator
VSEIDRLIHEPARLIIVSSLYVQVAKAFVDKRPRTTYKLTKAGRRAFEQYRASVEGLLNATE